jgi:TolA-binding protein
MDKNYDETLALYKKSIDTSVDGQVSYEARVRYVAFRSVRKKVLDDRDQEIRIFLEQDKNATSPDKNLTKLLQQVRLRTLIVDGKFKEALAYLSLLPTISMAKIDARIFQGDGAEIIYGIISDFYKKSEYSQVIKAWQTYKDTYVDKVAMDPYMNFVVGASYVKLGLYKGFDEVFAAFERLKDTPNRTFPIWVDRNQELKASDLLAELVIVKDIKLKNWDLASKNIESFEIRIPSYNKTNYYKGLISFNRKDYKGAITNLENFFSKQDQRIIYDPSDVADMIRAYTDSIYELGQTDKFLKVSGAILNDTNSFGTDNAYIQNVRERIAYLGIEITAGKGTTTNYMLFEKMISDFKKRHPKSVYTGRVNYILGQSLVANQKIKEGREIFTNLVNDKTTSEYLKELAKSELSLMNLKERTL